MPDWSTYSRMGQVKFFKGCFPQILLGLFWNTLIQILHVFRVLVLEKHP